MIEFLTWFWISKVNPSFPGLTGMKFGSQVCVVSPEAVLALTKDYLHVQTRQRCSHELSTHTGTDFAGAKHKPPQLPILAKSWDLWSARMWHFPSCSLAAVQGFLGSLEEDREKMVGAVERQPDQRRVISIRTGCLSTAFPWLALRDGSLFCLHQASWMSGSLCMGHKLNMHREEPRPDTRLGPARCHLIPRMVLAKHETWTTGGRWAGNQEIKPRVLKHVNSRNHRTATLALENGTALLGPTAGQMLKLERQWLKASTSLRFAVLHWKATTSSNLSERCWEENCPVVCTPGCSTEANADLWIWIRKSLGRVNYYSRVNWQQERSLQTSFTCSHGVLQAWEFLFHRQTAEAHLAVYI